MLVIWPWYSKPNTCGFACPPNVAGLLLAGAGAGSGADSATGICCHCFHEHDVLENGRISIAPKNPHSLPSPSSSPCALCARMRACESMCGGRSAGTMVLWPNGSEITEPR